MRAPDIRLQRRFIIKAIVGVASLLFFLPQLSYKFYLCANVPTASYQSNVISRHPDPVCSSLMHERHHPLSIDKRYTFKDVFALAPVLPTLCGKKLSLAPGFCAGNSAIPDTELLTPNGRGPPHCDPHSYWFC